jgi:DNA transformation protein and related proteins
MTKFADSANHLTPPARDHDRTAVNYNCSACGVVVMATENYARFAAAVADTLRPIGAVSHRRFFGGQGLVCGEVQFAMIIDGVLYLRVDPELSTHMQTHGAQPFVYGTRKRDVGVFSYYSVPEECLDDEDLFLGWARRSLAVARQHWKPRAAKKAKKSKSRAPRQK